MSDYPDDIDSFRTTANRPGVVYDPLKTTTMFAEDNNGLAAAIVAIETILGTNPDLGYGTVRDALDDALAMIGSIPAISTSTSASFTTAVTGGSQGASNTFTRPRVDIGKESYIQLYRQVQFNAGVTSVQIRVNFPAVATSGLNARKVRFSAWTNTTNARIQTSWFDVKYTSPNSYFHFDVPWAWFTAAGFGALPQVCNMSVEGWVTRP